MKIPFNELGKETLVAIIEDYVTREGTDYGQIDYSLEDKVNSVIRQLERGEVTITFDEETETCSISPCE